MPPQLFQSKVNKLFLKLKRELLISKIETLALASPRGMQAELANLATSGSLGTLYYKPLFTKGL